MCSLGIMQRTAVVAGGNKSGRWMPKEEREGAWREEGEFEVQIVFFFGYLFTIIGISDRVRHDFQGHRCELC